MKFLILFTLLFFSNITAYANSHIINIESTGYGASEVEATKDALNTALHSAVGSYLVSHSEVKNRMLVQDRIIQHAQGKIESYTKLSSAYDSNNKIYTTVLDAQVEKSMLANALQSVIGSEPSSSLNVKNTIAKLKKDIEQQNKIKQENLRIEAKEKLKNQLNNTNKKSISQQFKQVYIQRLLDNKIMGIEVDGIEIKEEKGKSVAVIKYHTFTRPEAITLLKSLLDNVATKITKGPPVNRSSNRGNTIAITALKHLEKRGIYSYLYHLGDKEYQEIISLIKQINIGPRIEISLQDRDGFSVRSWYEDLQHSKTTNGYDANSYPVLSIIISGAQMKCEQDSPYISQLKCGQRLGFTKSTKLGTKFDSISGDKNAVLGFLHSWVDYPFNNIQSGTIRTNPMLFISDQVHHFQSQITFDNAEEVLEIENIKISLDLFGNKNIKTLTTKPAWP
jgi:hypothetical protein